MKDGARVSRCSNEKGSTAYTFLGFVIIAVVVIGTIFFFPWGEIGKGPNPDMIAAGKAMDSKDWKQAMTLYDKVLKANPGNFDALLGRSRAFVQLGNLDKAFADANAAVEKRPTGAHAYGQRGIVLKLQQKTDLAQQDFGKAVTIDPGYVWAYAQLADLNMKANELDKALANVNKAVSSKPNFVEALRLRAWVLNRMGKCKEASEDFKKVEQIGPADAWTVQDKAWFLLTCSDEKVQDTAKAMELAKKAADLPDGKDGLIFETLAEAYFRQGDAVKAADLQKKAIDMGSKKCPDGSCTKEMKDRLQKYELASRQEVRTNYEILPLDSGK
jgi:tetratricopeptide (TPR) repeat protein